MYLMHSDALLQNERASFEPALLSVLIKLMTYLLPRLALLHREDGSAASRFSSMVDLMLKKSKFHVSVVLESLIFFDCLSAHSKLLSSQYVSVTGSGNVQSSVLALTNGILDAQRIVNIKSKTEGIVSNCRGSTTCLRKVVTTMSTLVKDPSATTMTATTVISDLLGLLQSSMGSRYYLSSPLFRGIASPLQAENEDTKSLTLELRKTIEFVILCDIENLSMDCVVRWLLIFRAIFNGDYDDSDTPKVIHDIFQKTGPCRWQLRCEVAKLSTIVLHSLENILRDRNSESTQVALHQIISHAGSFVTTSCAICVATSDESELPAYQKQGLRMLQSLIRTFAGIPDPADKNSNLLDDFVSQIVPSVKHALSYDIEDAEDSIDMEGARELYLSGCECFQVLAKEGLITDLHALKRLLKTVLPSGNILAFSPYPMDGDADLHGLHVKPTSFIDNRTSVLLPRIGSLWTIAELYIAGEMGLLQSTHFEAIKNDLDSLEDVVAINSAALAIDACRLKEISRIANLEGSEAPLYEMKSGLTFLHIQDVDIATKDAMAKSCASMACFALILILKLLQNESETSGKYADLMSWTGKLVDVILVEFYELFDIAECSSVSEATRFNIVAPCLLVLRSTLECSSDLLPTEEIKQVLQCIFSVMKFTGLSTDDGEAEEKIEMKVDTEVMFPVEAISQACSFVEVICKSEKADQVGRKFLLQRLLTPLLETEGIDPEIFTGHTSNSKVLISLLKSSRFLLEGSDLNGHVVKPLLNYALENIVLASFCDDVDARSSFHDLIKHCISTELVSDDDRLLCALQFARNGNWDTWKLCINNDLTGVANSMPYIKDALSDHSNESSHVGALTSIADMMKDCPNLVPTIFRSVGPHVLELFHLYGTHQLQGNSRTVTCATSMKIVMFTFQHLSSPPSVDGVKEASFLNVIFGVLVGIVTYNGLPNEPSSNSASDPALGRMCAQFFVHVLRSSPAAFKQCMATVDANVRATLESAVRADMSGYANRAAPVKKKLNLKSFKN